MSDWVHKWNDEIVDEETFNKLTKEHSDWVKEFDLKQIEIAKLAAKPEKVRKIEEKNMNERIRELWRDCVLKHTNDPMNWQTVADEFAELIIKECLDQCYNRGMNSELYNGQLKAAAYIEEHFGINPDQD